MRRTSLGIRAAEEGQQETSRFITLHWEGARLMRNCLCPCPALSDASDTFEHTYHVYAERTCMMVLVNGRTRARAGVYPVSSCSQLCRTSLRAPPLCFFVRAKIINGQNRGPIPRSVSLMTMTKLAPQVHPLCLLLLLSSSEDVYCALSRATSIDVDYCNGNGIMPRFTKSCFLCAIVVAIL